MRALPLISSACVLALAFGLAAAAQIAPAPSAPSAPIDLRFDFNTGPGRSGYTRVAPGAIYSDDTGYGYETGAQLASGDNGQTTTSDKPFFFSIKAAEGNFK